MSFEFSRAMVDLKMEGRGRPPQASSAWNPALREAATRSVPYKDVQGVMPAIIMGERPVRRAKAVSSTGAAVEAAVLSTARRGECARTQCGTSAGEPRSIAGE